MTPAELRALFLDETLVHRMTSSAPPVTHNLIELKGNGKVFYDVVDDKEPADRNGENLSAEMVVLLGGIIERHDVLRCPDCQGNVLLQEQRTSYSPRHSIRAALIRWERVCRKEHRPPSWHDHTTPICSELLRMMIVEGVGPWYAAQALGVTYPRALRLLALGADTVTRWLEEAEDRALGITDAGHLATRECPNPEHCAVCSASYSPSVAAKAT